MALKVSDYTKLAEPYVKKAKAQLRGGGLWPDRYMDKSPDAAFRFITECCWTENEANQLVELIPAKDYIYDFAGIWWETKLAGQPLIIKKSRRMIISWTLRALDLWDSGVAPGRFFIAAQKYDKSASMIYRNQFLYDQLQMRRPEFHLEDVYKLQFKGPKALNNLTLPNGSVYEPLTGENPEDFRQDGATRVVCEEIAFWPNLAASWGNAITMVKGKPGTVGGHPVAVSTVDANIDWREMTKER